MDVWDALTAIFLAGGVFIGFTGALGILRMPDFYTRLHPAGKSDTLSQALIVTGLLLQAGDVNTGVKLVMVTVFLFLTAPTATHAISQAAYRDGLAPGAHGTGDDAAERPANGAEPDDADAGQEPTGV